MITFRVKGERDGKRLEEAGKMRRETEQETDYKTERAGER
jgi:hypothetical protein